METEVTDRDSIEAKKYYAAELPWGDIDVDVVLECTGFYTSKSKAQAQDCCRLQNYK